MDLLTLAKIIPDDNWTVINSLPMYTQGVSKENPGALIVITEAKPKVIDLFNFKAA
jgi:transcription antitermination factor NusA-like protein